jgi:opacity protein-like surface antigen
MMPMSKPHLKRIALAAIIAAAPAFAQENESWYAGHSTGFWGLKESVGFRGPFPRGFGITAASPDGLTAQRQYGGYRLSDLLAVEGAQTSFGVRNSSCNADPLSGDGAGSCYGATWSVSGVATLPFESGLSIYGRFGMHFGQAGTSEDSIRRSALEDFGRVYGVGLHYGISKSVTVHAETEYYTDLAGNGGAGRGPGLGLDASVHSIGLSVKF